MQTAGITMDVLVNNRPVIEYVRNTGCFIEGRCGQEYALRFHNSTPDSLEIVATVDGLSVIDGKPVYDEQSKGYILYGRGTLVIPGWRLDANQAAKFVFADVAKSYVAQATLSGRNAGVIGARIYSEQPPVTTLRKGGILRGSGFDEDEVKTSGRGIGEEFGSLDIRSSNDTGGGFGRQADVGSKGLGTPRAAAVKANAKLGTGFGAATGFHTRDEEFKRGNLIAVLLLYYDSRDNLIHAGVLREPEITDIKPEAFPDSGPGCLPPPGWRGRGY